MTFALIVAFAHRNTDHMVLSLRPMDLPLLRQDEKLDRRVISHHRSREKLDGLSIASCQHR